MVLVVEDPFVTKFLRSLLTRDGFQVAAAQPRDALEMLRSRAIKVDLLVTNAPAHFTEVAERVPLLYLAAVPDLAAVAEFQTMFTMRKPFRPRQLLEAVRQLVAGPKQ